MSFANAHTDRSVRMRRSLVKELLSPDFTDDFEVVHSTFESHSAIGERATRPTQKVEYIVSVSLTSEIGDQRFTIPPGDSFRIHGNPFAGSTHTTNRPLRSGRSHRRSIEAPMSSEARTVFALFWPVFVTAPGPNAVNRIANGMHLGFRLATVGVLAILTQAMAFSIYTGIRGWISAMRPIEAQERPARRVYLTFFGHRDDQSKKRGRVSCSVFDLCAARRPDLGPDGDDRSDGADHRFPRLHNLHGVGRGPRQSRLGRCRQCLGTPGYGVLPGDLWDPSGRGNHVGKGGVMSFVSRLPIFKIGVALTAVVIPVLVFQRAGPNVRWGSRSRGRLPSFTACKSRPCLWPMRWHSRRILRGGSLGIYPLDGCGLERRRDTRNSWV